MIADARIPTYIIQIWHSPYIRTSRQSAIASPSNAVTTASTLFVGFINRGQRTHGTLAIKCCSFVSPLPIPPPPSKKEAFPEKYFNHSFIQFSSVYLYFYLGAPVTS